MRPNNKTSVARVKARLLRDSQGKVISHRKGKKIRKKGRTVKGKGLGLIIGAIARAAARAAPAIARVAKTGARIGLRAARNPNTWKALGKKALAQGISTAANEGFDALKRRVTRKKPQKPIFSSNFYGSYF